jgi:hypothetical protein
MVRPLEVSLEELRERVDSAEERRISFGAGLCSRPQVLEEPDRILARRQPAKLADLSKQPLAVRSPAPAIIVRDVGERSEAVREALAEHLRPGREIGRTGQEGGLLVDPGRAISRTAAPEPTDRTIRFRSGVDPVTKPGLRSSEPIARGPNSRPPLGYLDP